MKKNIILTISFIVIIVIAVVLTYFLTNKLNKVDFDNENIMIEVSLPNVGNNNTTENEYRFGDIVLTTNLTESGDERELWVNGNKIGNITTYRKKLYIFDNNVLFTSDNNNKEIFIYDLEGTLVKKLNVNNFDFELNLCFNDEEISIYPNNNNEFSLYLDVNNCSLAGTKDIQTKDGEYLDYTEENNSCIVKDEYKNYIYNTSINIEYNNGKFSDAKKDEYGTTLQDVINEECK